MPRPQPSTIGERIAAFAENLKAGMRILCLRRVEVADFHAGGGQLTALVALSLLVNLAAAFAFVGPDGYFNTEALPSAVFGILLVLLAGWIIARWSRDRRLAWTVPVAVAAAAISLNVLADVAWMAIDRGWPWVVWPSASMHLYYFFFAWWSLATLRAVALLSRPAGRSWAFPVGAFAAIVLVPTWLIPAGWLWEAADPDVPDTGDVPARAALAEEAFYAQPEMLRRTLERIAPQRPGIADLYFVGFAPYASQDVFMKEMASVEKLLKARFDVGGRSVVLVSNPALVEDAPIASLTSLRRALQAVGRRINRDEDIVLLHITSHGSEAHELSVEFQPLQLAQIRPADVRAALDDAKIRWRIVVVSACYSGGFIDALEGPTTLVVTAADARHTSFGCADDSDYTYFSRAFYEEALRQTWSFPEAFALARESIRKRELREKLEPSNPQMVAGDAITAKLGRLAARLSKQDR